MSLALPVWLGRPSPRTVDTSLAVVAALTAFSASLADPATEDDLLLGLVLALAAGVPLLVRRRWPFAALAALLAVALASPPNGALTVSLLVIVFTVGAARSWPVAATAAAAAVGVHVICQGAGDIVSPVLYVAVVAVVGLYVGSRRVSLEALRERAERLDRERALLAERAVAEERVRIAQELHDVVAHNVSLIVVQAQALGATVADPRVAEATTAIADLGRQAMREMHRTLELLRAGTGEGASRSPQPGLANLDELLAQSRAAGLHVELAIEGAPRPLSQSADLSAYRIVQEALTNVVKHAGRADTTVTLGYRDDGLEIRVTDVGDASAEAGEAVAERGGHGLVGMRERAALFGGTLTAGPLGDHGFEVRGLLPYGGGGAA